ncbi:HigA family addiction module antitoxin [Azospirillum sp. SYSU D00513]|uniref:HigA family addiction module antitoxin n=1 Tax=Azospirillum sp. SYSU D00513 TaxID=2812561 RepID=UPI001A971E5A|nr:HigA family addiction module antitoxin [Azospirillum sp. SYSU D00513]
MHTSPSDYAPIHPGTILREEFLEPMGLSAYKLAKDISVPLTRITAILDGKRSITADTALRLSKYFGMSERFWINLQTNYEIEVAKDELGDRLETEVRPRAA